MDLFVPDYILPNNNIFALRQHDWDDSRIVQNVLDMLQCGEQYGIKVKSIELVKNTNIDKKEIRKTLAKSLNITLSFGGDKELDVSYVIPWLINNHFFIGGNKKICVYQLFDRPVIYRDGMIKVRTNIHTFTLIKKSRRRNSYFWYLAFFGKEIPFIYLYYALKGEGGIVNDLGIENGQLPPNMSEYLEDYISLIQDGKTFLEDDSVNRNKLLGKFFNRKEDSEIISNIKLVTEIDIFSRKFMATDNIIDEFAFYMKNGAEDDSDYLMKRIRFAEQVIYTFLAKDFYNLIVTVKGSSRKTTFHVNSQVVIQNANQSPIVQFDHSINPLAELSMLTRLSITGPGGFEKDNVPAYLRDIHPSMYGKICPADTGDRENCGSTQYLLSTNTFDDDMCFQEQKNRVINSIAISHVPFLEHNDPTRLQMSSSQQRHAVALRDFDVPRIQTGIESMYTDKTTFMFRAKRNGKVVYKDKNDIIVVKYDNNECEAFNIGYRKLFLSVADFYKTYLNLGDEFKAGDIISESNYLTSGRLNIGRNLKTAIMVWYGYNFEDGIVISDSLVNDKKLTSVHYLDLTFEIPPNKVLLNLNGNDYSNYKPIPEIGERLRKGDPYALIQTAIGINDSNDVVFGEPQERTVSEDCWISDIKIYANKWFSKIPQYHHFISNFIHGKKEKRKEMIDNLSKFLTQDELESFLESIEIDQTEKKRGNYKIKGDSIDGVRIEITAIYTRPIEVGDKIGNRHGNKGVISKIVPHDMMPKFSNGETAEVVINPLGIISRMNMGQVFELHLAQSVKDLTNLIKSKFDGGENENSIKEFILNYIKIIDNTDDKNYTLQMTKFLSEVPVEAIVRNLDRFYIIQPPYESVTWDKLVEALNYTGTKMLYDCYDPIAGKNVPIRNVNGFESNIMNPIAFGDMYFIKMNHISRDKIAARSIGPYAPKTSQPLEGKGRKGGQRLGEMEVWALIGHGATINLAECLTTKSDSIKKRNKYLSHMIHNDDMLLDDDDDEVSQSIRLFQSLLKTMGLDYQIHEETEEIQEGS